MSTVKHVQTAVFLENLHSINVMNFSSIFRTNRLACRLKVSVHDATKVVQRIVAERLAQCVAVRIVYIKHSIDGIYCLIGSGIGLQEMVAREIQLMYINCLSEHIRH